MSPNRQRLLGAAIALVAAGGVLALRVGFNRGVLFAMALTAIPLSIALYFDTRNRNAPPSRPERAIALAWLAFRRVVCFGAALLVVIGIALVLAGAPWTPGVLAGVVVAAAFAWYFAWIGWYGMGRRYSIDDDVQSHAANKRRYGWGRKE